MRVCHFGSATLDTHYFANLCKGLHAKGVSLVLGSLHEKQAPAWIKGTEGARYFSLGARSRFNYPMAVLRLARMLRRERIDILQTHLFHAGVIGVLAARLARVPVTVVTRHHTTEVELIGTKLHRALDRFMTREADYVVGLSHAVRNHMISREGAPEDKIEVIYQGFDFDALSATEEERRRVRAEFGLDSQFVIGCVARFFKTKGHDTLLMSLRELKKEIPEIRLLLLGGGDTSAALDLIHAYGLEDHVILAGHRKDVPACMRAMDVVVHPSLTEAFCQAHIEAMAAGTALVATNVAAAPEVITQGETGMLVPTNDPSAIVSAVLELYRNPEHRRRMASAGQESVRRRFTIERMVDQQESCYQIWLRKSSPSGKNHVATQV